MGSDSGDNDGGGSGILHEDSAHGVPGSARVGMDGTTEGDRG